MKTILILAIVALLAVGVSSSSGNANTGLRVAKVTEHMADGSKVVHTFTLDKDDRLYVTNHEAEVVHTDTGLSDEVAFTGHFGNLAVTRVGR